MSDQVSRDELEQIQLQSALLRLSEANSRIAQLEREVRLARTSADAPDQKLAKLVEHICQVNDVNNMFPAYVMSQVWDNSNTVRRQEVWFRSCNALGLPDIIANLVPHDDTVDPMTIMVRGSGGYGDMLYMSAVIRALYYHFDHPRIYVVHEHPGVKSILTGNPYLIDAIHVSGEQSHRLLQLATAMDVFDLIADVRYAVSYATPPRSRVEGDFLAEANTRALPWQKYIRHDWPYLNNIFGREVVDKGFSQYSFSLYTANIESILGNFGDFMFAQAPGSSVSDLLSGPYVTVHHGADRNMASADGLQTKNLPLAKWLDVVAQVKATGLRTVQLGEAHEQLITGVDCDLRGQCSIAQSAMVLRHAQAHIDTEGGLVHLARAVGTPSVVAFGPTSLPFFGYPENTNLAAETCGDCWWTSRDWAVRCPRELPLVMCMESHSAGGLADAAIALSTRVSRLAFSSMIEAVERGDALDVGRLVPTRGRGAVVGVDGGVVAQLAEHGAAHKDIGLFVLGDGFHLATGRERLYPATWTRVPLDSSTLDWMLCCLSDTNGPLDIVELGSIFFECARIVEQGEIIFALNLNNTVISLRALKAVFRSAIGGRLEVDLTGAPGIWRSGVYRFTVQSGKLSINGGKVNQSAAKGWRGFDALASDMIARFSGAARGGNHD